MRGHEHLHPEKITEGRHRADFAIRETLLELILSGQLDGCCADGLCHALEVHLVGCRQHHLRQPSVDLYHYALGEVPTGHMDGLGDLLSGIGGRVLQNGILDVLLIEILSHSLHGHGVHLSRCRDRALLISTRAVSIAAAGLTDRLAHTRVLYGPLIDGSGWAALACSDSRPMLAWRLRHRH